MKIKEAFFALNSNFEFGWEIDRCISYRYLNLPNQIFKPIHAKVYKNSIVLTYNYQKIVKFDLDNHRVYYFIYNDVHENIINHPDYNKEVSSAVEAIVEELKAFYENS